MKLRAAQLPPEWAMVEDQAQPRCRHTVKEIRSLMESLRWQLPEFRRAQALRYPLAGIVCLIVMAMATGVRQGPDDLEKYADTLSHPQLRALGFRQDRRTGRHRSPKKTTFTRVLAGVDAPVLERVLLEWQQRLTGPVQDSLVVRYPDRRHDAEALVVLRSGQVLLVTKDRTGPALLFRVHARGPSVQVAERVGVLPIRTNAATGRVAVRWHETKGCTGRRPCNQSGHPPDG